MSSLDICYCGAYGGGMHTKSSRCERKSIDLPLRTGIPLRDQCSHGKLWTEFCRECRIVWLEDGLEKREQRLARDKAELAELRAVKAKEGEST